MILTTAPAVTLAMVVSAESPATTPVSSADEPLLTIPLAVGNRWTYTEETLTKKGVRVLLVFGKSSTTRESNGTRELEIVAHDAPSDRYEAVVTHTPPAGPPSAERFTVWNDARGTWMLDEAGVPVPASTGPAMPGPLPTEVVPCEFRLLRVEQGECAAVGGGPLNAPHGLLSGVLHQGKSSGSLRNVAVLVITGGLVMPYSSGPQGILKLKESTLVDGPPPPSLFLEVMKKRKHRARGWRMRWLTKRYSPTTEELAVAITRTRSYWLVPTLPVMLKAAPPEQRHSLLRVSMTGRTAADALGLFLVAHPLLPSLTDDERTALLRASEDNVALMQHFLDDGMPFLEDWLRRDRGRADIRLLPKALRKHTPTPVEMRWGLTLLRRDVERIEALRLFIPLVPDDQLDRFFDELVTALEAFDRDKARVEAMSMLAPLVPEAHRGELLLRMAQTLEIDPSACLAAAKLVLPWTPEGERGTAFLKITAGLQSGSSQLKVLAPGLSLLTATPTNKKPTNKTPTNDMRLEVFVTIYERLREDDERMQAVQAHVELVSGATVMQRKRLLIAMEDAEPRQELAELLGL